MITDSGHWTQTNLDSESKKNGSQQEVFGCSDWRYSNGSIISF